MGRRKLAEVAGHSDGVMAAGRGLVTNTYRPMQARKREIAKDGGNKIRVLSIPAIRDRVVQGPLKLILEPIFEADFQSGSYGYRPKTNSSSSGERVALSQGGSASSVSSNSFRLAI